MALTKSEMLQKNTKEIKETHGAEAQGGKKLKKVPNRTLMTWKVISG